jgi:hypothetical protein
VAGDGAATTIKNHTEDKPREIDFTEDILIADFGFWRYFLELSSQQHFLPDN